LCLTHFKRKNIKMNKLLAILLAAVTITATAGVTGTGATFPAPVYSKWASEYNKATGNKVNYTGIGSSGGIKQIDSKTVDFGATDDPRKASEVKDKGQFQFPTVIGGVVPVLNIKGIESGTVVLDGTTLANIFLGKITKWNDGAIKALNPTVALPNLTITVVVRSDGSGTTAVFTDYLSKVSKEFKDTVGAGKAVKWPNGNFTAGKGNAGVASFTKLLDGTISYVEYAYVKQGGLTYIAIKNKEGKVVHPSAKGFAEAAAGADWSIPGMAVNLNNGAGWPITSATFILVYCEGNVNTKSVLKFFDWAFTNGDAAASSLEYVPLPKSVKDSIRTGWAKNIK